MTELWFDRELGNLSRRGGMLYAARPGGVWAVRLWEPVYPDDLALESDQLLGHYGATVGGLGYLLHGDGVPLPASLEAWATVRDRPAAELGSWLPCLISIDNAFQLALSRDFQGLRVFATTRAGQHLTVITPSSELTTTLIHRDDLNAPPPE